jgi:hypothetical protein
MTTGFEQSPNSPARQMRVDERACIEALVCWKLS